MDNNPSDEKILKSTREFQKNFMEDTIFHLLIEEWYDKIGEEKEQFPEEQLRTLSEKIVNRAFSTLDNIQQLKLTAHEKELLEKLQIQKELKDTIHDSLVVSCEENKIYLSKENLERLKSKMFKKSMP